MKLKSFFVGLSFRKANRKVTFGVSLFIAALGFCNLASGQAFPNFPVATQSPTAVLEYGAATVQFGSSLYPNSLFMIYVNGSQPNNLALAYSTDGINYTDTGSITDSQTGQRYNVNCDSDTPATCGVAVAVLEGNAYIAFADQTTHGLDVVEASTIPGNAGWEFKLLRTDNSVQLSSAPSMVVAPNNNLIIRYGTTQADNNTYTSVLTFGTNVWNVYSTTGYAPTQSAMVVFNGTLYAIDKQNNSDNGVWVSKLDNNGLTIAGTPYQVPGWFTKDGISAVVYKGTIVAAVQSSSSDHDVWVFSSADGQNWTGHQYTTNQAGATPTVANYNNGVALAYQANNSSRRLFSTWAQ